MIASFKRARQEKAVRQALTAEFGKQGLDFASFDPTIQRTMVMAALASESVQEQEGVVLDDEHQHARDRARPRDRRPGTVAEIDDRDPVPLGERGTCLTSLSANW